MQIRAAQRPRTPGEQGSEGLARGFSPNLCPVAFLNRAPGFVVCLSLHKHTWSESSQEHDLN
jgi:hypothetical protein